MRLYDPTTQAIVDRQNASESDYDRRVRELRAAGAGLQAAHETAHREQADRELAVWRAAHPDR